MANGEINFFFLTCHLQPMRHHVSFEFGMGSNIPTSTVPGLPRFLHASSSTSCRFLNQWFGAHKLAKRSTSNPWRLLLHALCVFLVYMRMSSERAMLRESACADTSWSTRGIACSRFTCRCRCCCRPCRTDASLQCRWREGRCVCVCVCVASHFLTQIFLLNYIAVSHTVRPYQKKIPFPLKVSCKIALTRCRN